MNKLSHCRLLILAVLFTFVPITQAQTNPQVDKIKQELSRCPEKTAGIYYAYPAPDESVKQAAPPAGYQPIYVSHYGRHGSRRLTADSRYEFLIDVFNRMNSAKQLTSLGEDVRRRLQIVWADAHGRGGQLTRIGEEQHRGIAERMAKRCPQIFNSGVVAVSATSSIVPRCILSMAAFCERLKEINPALIITREASQRTMDIIAWTSPEAKALENAPNPWKAAWQADREANIQPQRFLSALFLKPEMVDSARYFMEEMYALASDMQDVQLPVKVSFYDLFTADELYAIWNNNNWRMYICNAAASAGQGIGPKSSASLLLDIIEQADSALVAGQPTATLRFGHDTNLIRLLTLMQIDGCCDSQSDPTLFPVAWRGYEISPMAANLQLTFYRNASGRILVKLMLNERDVRLPLSSKQAPFYPWADVKAFWMDVLK